MLVVTGSAGIGKTALLHGVRERALARGFVIAHAKADSVDEVAAGALVLLALRSGAKPVLDAAAFGGLALVYDKRLWLADQVADALETRAQSEPVLIVLDDIQFADRVSRFLIRVLVHRLSGSPIVWALARRGTWVDAVQDVSALGEPGELDVEHLAIGPLADDDVLLLAADIAGDRLLTPAPRRGVLAAAGNPLLASQLAHEIATGSGDATPSSPSLIVFLRARCRELHAETVELLHLTAVWGRALPAADAAELLSAASEQEVFERAVPAVTAELIDVGQDLIDFRHDLIREFFYADLARPARVALHRSCADFILRRREHGVTAVVPHALACAQSGDAEVLPMLRAAAAQFVDSLPGTAVDLGRAALDLVQPDDPAWPTVGRELAELLATAQRNAEAVEVVDHVVQRGTQPAERGRLEVVATRALWPMGRLREITERVDATLATDDVSADIAARLTATKALALTRLQSAQAASATADLALEMSGGNDPDVELLALEAKGLSARNETRYELARTQFHLLRRRFGPRSVSQEIRVLQNLDRYPDAQRLLDEASRYAGSVSDPRYPDVLTAQLWQEWHLGNFEAVTVGAETVLRLSDELGTGALKVEAWLLLSIYAAFQMRFDDADALINRAALDASSDEVIRRPEINLVRGYLAAVRGDYASAVSYFRPLMSDAAQRHHYWPHSQEWPRLQAGAAMGARDAAFAAQCVAQAELLHERNPGVATIEGVALMTRGYVDQDTGTLERAVEVLGDAPRPMLHAQALSDLGHQLMRTGRRERAVTHLERALSIYERIGVELHAENLRKVLGGDSYRVDDQPPSRSRQPYGWDSLTDAERVVAGLVAEGLTNRAAAQRLFVSVHTVNTHVRAVFTKLDLHSRVQLANAWRARPVQA